MNTWQEMEDRLWDYIDGLSAAPERSEIQHLLDSHLEWRQKYEDLLETHRLLAEAEMDAPSMRFTKNVMEEIAKYHVAPATKTYINKKIILGIGSFFGITILAFLIYLFAHLHWTGSSSDTLIGDHKIANPTLGKFVDSTYVNIFMLVNTVLGLMLLDMYLQRKKQKTSAH